MSDGTLSQDEIDALLQGTDDIMSESMGSTTSPGMDSPTKMSGESITEADKAAIGELLREIGNNQASALSTLITSSTKFQSPFIDSGSLDNMKRDVKGKIVQAKVPLTGGINGEWVYVVPDKSVLMISNILIGSDDNTDLSELVLNTFQEVVSQLTGSMLTVLNEKLSKNITPGSPQVSLLQDGSAINVTGGAFVVRLSYLFNIDGKGSAKFYAFLPIAMARNIIMAFNAAKATASVSYGAGPAMQQQMGVPVRAAAFEALQMGMESEGMGNISLLANVPMLITVELGRTKMIIKDILGLGEGSIIELEKLAGEPVDIMVNDRPIAQGEVVVIDENFAVRVTKILTPKEQLFDSSQSKTM